MWLIAELLRLIAEPFVAHSRTHLAHSRDPLWLIADTILDHSRTPVVHTYVAQPVWLIRTYVAQPVWLIDAPVRLIAESLCLL